MPSNNNVFSSQRRKKTHGGKFATKDNFLKMVKPGTIFIKLCRGRSRQLR